MKNLVLVLLLALTFGFTVYSENSMVNNIYHPTNCDISSTENRVLVFIDGSWWWVSYNEDGSIRTQIPADF